MVLANIYSIPTFLTHFDWVHNSALDTVLWASIVDPQLHTNYTGTVPHVYQPTALAFVANLFNYWRGTIKYRFEIVCSQYHRGKLGVFYEPNINQMSIINAGLGFTKQFTKIVDIQETQDFEICVNWAQPFIWGGIFGEASDTADIIGMYGSSGVTTSWDKYANGYIGLYPFNELQSPDGSDITVNVYVSAIDMEFQVVDDDNLPQYRSYASESRDDAKPQVAMTCFDMNPTSERQAHASEMCFGEQILSLRSIVKRYMTTAIVGYSVPNTTHAALGFTCNIIKPASPKYNGGQEPKPSMLKHLPLAFLGVKGGTRHRFRYWDEISSNSHFPTKCVKVGMASGTTSLTESFGSIITTYSDTNLLFRGSSMYLPYTNGGVEAEFPFYSPNLFYLSFSSVFGGTNTDTNFFVSMFNQIAIWIDHQQKNNQGYFEELTAGAEDFTFIRYQGAPYWTTA